MMKKKQISLKIVFDAYMKQMQSAKMRYKINSNRNVRVFLIVNNRKYRG